MAYSAKLTIDDLGEEYEDIPVFQCEFEFNRKVDISTGHLLSKVQAGLIKFVVDSTKTTSILDWLLLSEQKDGKVIFKGDTMEGKMATNKKIIFTKARCVGYRETYEDMTGNAMRCYFSIWCQTIEVGSSVYEVQWEEKDKYNM